MKRNPRIVIAAGVIVGLVAVSIPTPAFSQPTGSLRLPGGLFGGSDDQNARHKLDFSFSVVEANDSDTPTEFLGAVPAEMLLSGYSTLLKAAAGYEWRAQRLQVAAGAASALRYYSQLETVSTVSHTAGFAVTARISERTTLSGTQNVDYSPANLYGLFPTRPGGAVPAAPDYALSDSESYNYDSTVTITHGLSRRNRLWASGEFHYTDFPRDDALWPDLHYQRIRGGFDRNLARRTTLRAGYSYRRGSFGYGVLPPQLSATEQVVEAGLEYSRALSATRRLVFAFNLGSSALNLPADSGNLYRFSGDVGVAWQFSTAWQARGVLRRGLEYVSGLSQPVYIDGFTAELAGLITDRLDLVTSARYSTGMSALHRDAPTFDTYGADLRIRYALTRELALYGEYLYYYYDLRGNPLLAPSIPPALRRTGIRAGMTVWMPAVRR